MTLETTDKCKKNSRLYKLRFSCCVNHIISLVIVVINSHA